MAAALKAHEEKLDLIPQKIAALEAQVAILVGEYDSIL